MPVQNELSISFNAAQSESFKVSVTDVVTGEVVFEAAGTSKVGDNEFQSALASLKNGIYFLHVVSPTPDYHERIEVRR